MCSMPALRSLRSGPRARTVEDSDKLVVDAAKQTSAASVLRPLLSSHSGRRRASVMLPCFPEIMHWFRASSPDYVVYQRESDPGDRDKSNSNERDLGYWVALAEDCNDHVDYL